MQKLHFTIHINASSEKVWKTMLADASYREWTAMFNPPDSGGVSFYEGKWETGSDINFIGVDKDGSRSGMLGKIAEARPYEFVSIEYRGELDKGVEKLYTSEELGPDGAHENYTFTEKDGGTELQVDLDSKDEYAAMFQDMWPKALEVLKGMAEK